ncbi:NAD(P)H-dependent oxidoreductase [Aestuariibius sp. 2305UL40-4]|uniref:NAD(P)H-dependent oxidoreductase n=1 Tax=Aestuariibius violaceus TaxID=3234132 RepID=UPI00345EFB12
MKILIVQGHPDPNQTHLGHALATAYADGARDAGHEVRKIAIADAPVTFIRSQADFEGGTVPAYATEAQEAILWADHLVFLFPLWMGTMPALLKAWIEQVFRYGFALAKTENGYKRMLKHKTGRIVVTMGMPAIFYRAYFGAPGTKVLRRPILGVSGVGPIRQTFIGRVDSLGEAGVRRWCDRLHNFGADGA